MAPRRPRRPAAPRAERVRPIARRLSLSIWRNRRQPHHHHRTRSISPAPASRRPTCAGQCELQAKSHLIHLQRGFSEAGGDPNETVYLIASSPHWVQSAAGQHRPPRSRPVRPGALESGDRALAAFAEQHDRRARNRWCLEVLGFKPTAGRLRIPAAPQPLCARRQSRSREHVDGWNRR
mgnify:CR=1 FL=1